MAESEHILHGTGKASPWAWGFSLPNFTNCCKIVRFPRMTRKGITIENRSELNYRGMASCPTCGASPLYFQVSFWISGAVHLKECSAVLAVWSLSKLLERGYLQLCHSQKLHQVCMCIQVHVRVCFCQLHIKIVFFPFSHRDWVVFKNRSEAMPETQWLCKSQFIYLFIFLMVVNLGNART